VSGQSKEASQKGQRPLPTRRPYEPPKVEVLELRPEEQLLACSRLPQDSVCRDLGNKRHS
jgi:hypothetical protein